MHPEFQIRHLTLRWAGTPKCLRVDPHRAKISKEFFDQAKGRGIFVDTVLAEARWLMEHVENHARYLRMMGNRTMEDLDIDEADFQHLLEELTDANKNLVQHKAYSPRQWVLVSSPRVLGHVQISWSVRTGSGNRLSTDINVGWQRLRWKRTRRSDRA